MNELAHYGILGMRWGVRRTPEQLGHTPSDAHEDHSKARAKRSYQMSDRELNDSINRIRKENEYDELTATGWEKARLSVEKTLANSGGKVAATVIGTVTAATLARYVTPVIKGDKTLSQVFKRAKPSGSGGSSGSSGTP